MRQKAMIPENKLLFICTRKNFQLEHQEAVLEICNKSKIKWEVVHLTALQHQVISLVYRNLLKCKHAGLEITSDILAKFKADVTIFYSNKLKQEQDITDVLSYFNKKSVDVMLIKGSDLNFTVYQDFPEYIIGDDTDLMLGNHFEEVSKQEDQEDITFFEKLNTFFEWERFQHHDVSMNGMLPIDFGEIWTSSKEETFKGQKVLIMSPENILLANCINSCRKRFFRLKSLCDIAETIEFFNTLNWEIFIKNTEKYCCRYIVYTSLLITNITVKSDLPKNVLSRLNISKSKAVLIYLLVKFLCNYVPLNSLLSSPKVGLLRKNITFSLILKFIVCNNWLRYLIATSK